MKSLEQLTTQIVAQYIFLEVLALQWLMVHSKGRMKIFQRTNLLLCLLKLILSMQLSERMDPPMKLEMLLGASQSMILHP